MTAKKAKSEDFWVVFRHKAKNSYGSNTITQYFATEAAARKAAAELVTKHNDRFYVLKTVAWAEPATAPVRWSDKS